MGRREVLDGYIRVSQVAGRSGDRFQSPDTQREVIEAWAKANGVRIGAWHEDLDRSGGTMDRPGIRAALERIEQGRSSGLVVSKLDRFARTTAGGLLTIQGLHDKGARIVSVAEQIDPATPMGRAMIGLLLIMAEWQRDQADEALATAQLRATNAGRFPGKPAYGYRRDDAGLTVVDEDAAGVVRRIFRARGGGTGWRAIADDLTRDDVATPGGRERWAPTTVQGIVRSEAYLGVFVGPRGLRVENAWPPLVTRDEWEDANEVRGVRDDARQYRDRLFAGVVRCATCRHTMSRTVNPGGFVSYGCRTVGCHGRGSIGAELLDEHLSAVVDRRLAGISLEPRAVDDGGEYARLVAARDKAVRDLEQLRDDSELRDAIGYRAWREGLLGFGRARDDAEAALAELRARRGVEDLDEVPDGVVPTLGALPWEVRRRVIEALVHSVWVRRSELRGPAARQHVDHRVRVVWNDDAGRPELPRRGGPTLRPLEW